jgi:hypothetical protein
MKKTILLFGLFIYSLNILGQEAGEPRNPGIYNQSYFFIHQAPILPDLQGWFYDNQSAVYIEARYGYEDTNTGSVYLGYNLIHCLKKWNLLKKIPQDRVHGNLMIGRVFGQVNGTSAAFKFEYSTSHIYLKNETELLDTTYKTTPLHGVVYEKAQGYGMFGGVHNNQFGVGLSTISNSYNPYNHISYKGFILRVGIATDFAIEGFWYYDQFSKRDIYSIAFDIENIHGPGKCKCD